MRYAYIQRKQYEPLGTIGEYILQTDLGTYFKLMQLTKRLPGPGSIVLNLATEGLRALLFWGDRNYYDKQMQNIKEMAYIMTERPKPGRGGLLPGETEGVLYD